VLQKQTSMRLVGFEPAIPVSEWPQTCVLDGTATEFDHGDFFQIYFTAESCSLPVYNPDKGQYTAMLLS